MYSRSQSEGDDPSDIPADVVHHFLLAITSRRGYGLCFPDNGWYPRKQRDDITVFEGETDVPLEQDEAHGDDSVTNPKANGHIHNKILQNFLKVLQVSEDLRQQELALKILEASPELVQG